MHEHPEDIAESWHVSSLPILHITGFYSTPSVAAEPGWKHASENMVPWKLRHEAVGFTLRIDGSAA